jgi:hypothetical protein
MPYIESSLNTQPLAFHNIKMADAAPEEVKARFEELSVLEAEFDDAELELSMAICAVLPRRL